MALEVHNMVDFDGALPVAAGICEKRAGWRMASTTMRLAVFAAWAEAFDVFIDGRHFQAPLP